MEPGLDDLTDPAIDVTRLDRGNLDRPLLVRSVLVAVCALAVLVWPERGQTTITTVIGAAMIVAGGAALVAGLRRRERAPARLVVLASIVGVGLAVVAARGESLDVVGRWLAVPLVLLGMRDAMVALRPATSGRAWAASRALAWLTSGSLLATFPDALFALVVGVVALGVLAAAAVTIAIMLDPTRGSVATTGDVRRELGSWITAQAQGSVSRDDLLAKILFEGAATRGQVVRFAALMSFASVIAAMGVINDSTAVVIGAMLIAPLMTPLMGMAMSLTMGWPIRLARAAGVAALGIALAIAIGALMGSVAPTVIDTAVNAQIVSRSAPTVLDLIVALAAGAAGAYGLSRPDVSDSLPGVAIAISLVPPLTTVGIAWSQGDFRSGNGALLLFATNMVAILVMGGATFVVTGMTPITQMVRGRRQVRTWVAGLAALGAFVIAGLFVNGRQLTVDALSQGRLENAVADWLGDDGDHRLVEIRTADGVVTVAIAGPSGGKPSASALARRLDGIIADDTTLEVRLLIEEHETVTVSG